MGMEIEKYTEYEYDSFYLNQVPAIVQSQNSSLCSNFIKKESYTPLAKNNNKYEYNDNSEVQVTIFADIPLQPNSININIVNKNYYKNYNTITPKAYYKGSDHFSLRHKACESYLNNYETINTNYGNSYLA